MKTASAGLAVSSSNSIMSSKDAVRSEANGAEAPADMSVGVLKTISEPSTKELVGSKLKLAAKSVTLSSREGPLP